MSIWQKFESGENLIERPNQLEGLGVRKVQKFSRLVHKFIQFTRKLAKVGAIFILTFLLKKAFCALLAADPLTVEQCVIQPRPLRNWTKCKFSFSYNSFRFPPNSNFFENQGPVVGKPIKANP